MADIIPRPQQQPSMIPIQQENGELWVDARALHAALLVGRDFSNWIKGRLEEVGAEEGVEFTVLDGSPILANGFNPKPRRDYRLSIDLAKEIAMMERNEIGKTIRKYFIQAEKQLRAQQPQQLDMTDPLAVAQAYVKAETERRALASTVQEQAPKVAAFDQLMDSTGLYLVREAAKMLGLGQNTLYTLLRQLGIIMQGGCEPYQRYVDAGHFVVKARTFMRGTEQGSGKTTYVTTTGLEYLRRRLLEAGLLQTHPSPVLTLNSEAI